MRVERALVFRIAIGRVVIGVLSAEVLAAVTRRYRVLRQAHADVLGQFLGTVIHHGRSQRCTLAQPEIAIALAVILEPFRRLLVPGACGSLLRRPRRSAAAVVAVHLAAEARAAQREHAHAEATSLEAKQRVVHRPGPR
jgi:hypothetical protein